MKDAILGRSSKLYVECQFLTSFAVWFRYNKQLYAKGIPTPNSAVSQLDTYTYALISISAKQSHIPKNQFDTQYHIVHDHNTYSLEKLDSINDLGVIFDSCLQWRIQSVYQGEGGIHGECAKREPITGVWGQSPQQGPGAEPLVGVRGAKPPLKLKAYQSLDVERRPQICPFLAFWEMD